MISIITVNLQSLWIYTRIEKKFSTKILMQHVLTAFVDVSPEEAEQKSPYESFNEVTGTSSSKDAQIGGVVSICC